MNPLRFLTTVIFLISMVGISFLNAQDEDFQRIGGWAEGPCNAVDITGDIVCYGNGCFLEIVDFSDPANPVKLAAYETPAYIYDVAIQDDFVFVANNDLGLRILDISDPSNPEEVSFLEMQGFYSRVLPAGPIVYFMTNSSNGLFIVDISTLATPTILTRIDVGSHGGMALAGDHIALAVRWNGLRIYDVSDPASPVEVAVIDDIYAYDVVTEGDRAYLSTGDSLVILDISNPNEPVQSGVVYPEFSYIHTADVESNMLYFAQANRLRIADVTDPASPVLHASFQNIHGFINRLTFRDGHVFAASLDNGVNVINVTNPDSPLDVSSFDAAGHSFDVVVRDDIAWLANGYDGLRAFDISDPASPVQISQFETDEAALAVTLVDHYAYVANSSDGLLVLDIQDPANPVEAIRVSTASAIRKLKVQGDFIYLAEDGDGLAIVDISDPGNPVRVGSYETENRVFDIDVVGTTAYLADWEGGVRIVDVSDPGHPVEIGFLDGIGRIQSVAVEGSYAYAGMSNPYVRVIDISDPADPVYVSEFFTARAYDIKSGDRGIYVSAGYNGVYLLDPTDPLALESIGYYDTGGEVYGSFEYGDLVFLADYNAGMMILRYGDITSVQDAPAVNQEVLSFDAVHPNPFRDEVFASFTLETPAHLTVRVCDASGNVVNTLIRDRVTRGTHDVIWDGTGYNGTRMPSGYYFFEMQSENGKGVHPVVLMRE